MSRKEKGKRKFTINSLVSRSTSCSFSAFDPFTDPSSFFRLFRLFCGNTRVKIEGCWKYILDSWVGSYRSLWIKFSYWRGFTKQILFWFEVIDIPLGTHRQNYTNPINLTCRVSSSIWPFTLPLSFSGTLNINTNLGIDLMRQWDADW